MARGAHVAKLELKPCVLTGSDRSHRGARLTRLYALLSMAPKCDLASAESTYAEALQTTPEE